MPSIRFKSLFCYHDWVSIRVWKVRHETVCQAMHNKLAFSSIYLDDKPDEEYCLLKTIHGIVEFGVASEIFKAPKSDYFCHKCEKFDLRLTNWLIKKNDEYYKLFRKISDRQQVELKARIRAKELRGQ